MQLFLNDPNHIVPFAIYRTTTAALLSLLFFESIFFSHRHTAERLRGRPWIVNPGLEDPSNLKDEKAAVGLALLVVEISSVAEGIVQK